jgi:signal transduction histidine kinase
MMAGSFQRSRPLILTADDDEMERFLQREVLEPAGFDIVEAKTGTAALQLFIECKPDLVLLDVMMPEMNGFDVCQAIRALPGGRNAPILLATALDDTESVDRAYRAGATDFIGKPINWPVLPHRVRYMLRAYQTLENLIVSQQHLAEAQRIAGIGNFTWPLHSPSIECSAELCRMFGLGDSATSVSVTTLLRRIPGADRRAVIRAVREGLRGERIDLDHRVVRPGEAVRILCLRAEVSKADDETACLQGSFEDITERKRIEVELATARDQARSADGAKTAFLAAMSHELRTPLNAIIGFSDLIAQQAFGPISEGRYVDYARNSGTAGQHMLGVVDDVLMIAQLEAGRFELVLESVDLAAIAESTIAEFRETEPGSMHEITVAVSGTPCPVNADSRAVKQMIQKLLSNAAKFSPRGTAIRVTIDAESDTCTRLQVADQGIGITAEMAELVIRPFRQADGRLARKYGGTGLGLSIVNALIERHGGRLTIDSAPSKGTCVSLDFVAEWEDATSRREMAVRSGSAELAAE